MTEQSPNNNTVNGPVTGAAVQAGQIHGGVHIHLPQPAPVPEFVLPVVPPPPPRPVRQGPRKRVLVAKFVGRWLWALLPLLVVSIVISSVGDLVAGPGPLPLRLLGDLPLLAALVLALGVWALATRRPFGALLTLVLDKATPRRIAELTAGWLLAVTCFAAFTCLVGLGREALPASTTRPPADAHGPVVFLVLLCLLSFRQFCLRRKSDPDESQPVA